MPHRDWTSFTGSACAPVGDLLFHFPRAYEDLTDIRSITALTPDKVQTVQGEVVEIDGKRWPTAEPSSASS